MTMVDYAGIVASYDKTISDQAQMNALLQERVAQLKVEKTQVEVEKAAMTADYLELQDAFERKMEKMDETNLNFYVNSILHQGSLSYLGPKFMHALDVVWEEVLVLFRENRDAYIEKELDDAYPNEESKRALVEG